jgi:hypothetical protein
MAAFLRPGNSTGAADFALGVRRYFPCVFTVPNACRICPPLPRVGVYPEVSLEHARERRDAARQDVANEIDPMQFVQAADISPWHSF